MLFRSANRADPVIDAGAGRPRALLYGERMSARLAVFDGAASEALAIAVRAQHIERWRLPRETYPEGRIGYLRCILQLACALSLFQRLLK